MKLETQNLSVERSGAFQERTFQIAANAKAFDILSSKLYTNTRLAIVRELSTNAWDAQVEAGNQDRPFDVQLPNHFVPHFMIRDYGTGLSPENVERIYTTYFASTRNDSNDFVGALGLGSKSPFSYTDQFTITSFWNGRAYVYSAFKNERGEPSIALLSEEQTDAPNGVEIRININPGDELEFQSAASKVYQFFPVRPKITGAKINFTDTFVPKFVGDDFKLYDDMQTNGMYKRMSIVMGNILYPVNDKHFTHTLGDRGVLLMFVNIGECEVSASREELHYSKTTIAAIQKRIDEALAKVNDEIEQAMKQYTCLIERLKAYRQYRALIAFKHTSQQIPSVVDKEYSLKKLWFRGEKLRQVDNEWTGTLFPDEHTEYWIIWKDTEGDLKQSDKNRIRHFLSTKRGQYFLATIEDHAKFEEIFGKPSATLSTLPDPPRAARTFTNANRTFIKRASDAAVWNRTQRTFWENVDGEIDTKDAIAVCRHGLVAKIGDNRVNGEEVCSLGTYIGFKQVYGIAEAYYERIRGELELPDFMEEAKAFTQKQVDALDEFSIAKRKLAIQHYEYPDQFFKWLKGLSAECDDFIKLYHAKPIDDELVRLMYLFGIEYRKTTDFKSAFHAKYPLISSININHVNKNDVIEYINLKK